MGVIAEGILRGYHGLSTLVSLGYPLSVFNKNSTLTETRMDRPKSVVRVIRGVAPSQRSVHGVY